MSAKKNPRDYYAHIVRTLEPGGEESYMMRCYACPDTALRYWVPPIDADDLQDMWEHAGDHMSGVINADGSVGDRDKAWGTVDAPKAPSSVYDAMGIEPLPKFPEVEHVRPE